MKRLSILLFAFLFSSQILGFHQQIVEDFQVNENAGSFGANQESQDIAIDGDGNFIIVWEDGRDGIYAQRYSNNGNPIGDNFRIYDDAGATEPAIAMDISGNFVITWVNNQNVEYNIYAQRFSTNGTPLGNYFQVNDYDNSAYRWTKPSISNDESGNFIIAWRDERNGNTDIYAQRYISGGIAAGANFKVNDDQGNKEQLRPSVAVSDSGSFVITWVDARDSLVSNIYAQRYSEDGLAIGNNIKVNDVDPIFPQVLENPSVGNDSHGNFTITWNDVDGIMGFNCNIFAKRYDSEGTALGENFIVNDDTLGVRKGGARIAVNDSSNFVITWQDTRDCGFLESNIYAQRYSLDGNAIGNNFQVTDTVVTSFPPSIIIDQYSNFVITWSDDRNLERDIFAQCYANDGAALGNNFEVTRDSGTADQFSPSITTDGNGNCVITWEDKRNYLSDIYAQRCSNDGLLLGSNFRVNDDVGIKRQESPDIASDSSGNFVIVWIDYRIDQQCHIYAQRYSADGTAQGSNIKVNNINHQQLPAPSISMNSGGRYVITWRWHNIYAQIYSSNGTAVGVNFQVNNNPVSISYSSVVAVCRDSNFIITWDDTDHIYAQRYSGDGTPLGNNFIVSDDTITANLYSPSIAVDDLGNFIITWNYYRDNESHIYAQRYSNDGTPISGNFRVDSTEGSSRNSSIARDSNGDFIITWESKENGPYSDIYSQRYSSNGESIGSNFIAANTTNRIVSSPDVKLWNERIYTTWVDNREGRSGLDIWANVLDWNNPVGIDQNELNVTPNKFVLFQNYPNPFNPNTKIRFSIPEPGITILKVYDILGREVATLINEEKTVGTYELTWYAENLPSGIYFYQLQAVPIGRQAGEFVETKKMLLLK